jgi:large subunit ribosomal protein L4
MKTDVITLAAKKDGTVELADHIFGLEPRADLIHRVVNWQLAKRRAGTHKVKNRSDIRATGAKMYRQKGTGRARHGDKKVPQFRGGGRAFGPHPRDHSIDLPKKVRALALRHALSAKAKSHTLMVLDAASLKEAKTARLAAALDKLGLKSALIVDGGAPDENFARAARNLPRIDLLPVAGINVYDVLKHDTLVLTKAALAKLEDRFNA